MSASLRTAADDYSPAWRDMIIIRQASDHNVEERPDLIPIQVAGLRPPCELEPHLVVAIESMVVTVSPSFRDAICRVEEWQAGRSLLRTFPQLEGKLNFIAEDELVVDSRQVHQLHWTG